jgi:hypothetical protein
MSARALSLNTWCTMRSLGSEIRPDSAMALFCHAIAMSWSRGVKNRVYSIAIP